MQADLERAFAVNTIGPLLVLKHFKTQLEAAGEPSDGASSELQRPYPVVATLSARLGSIGDNQSGGWYSYRSRFVVDVTFSITLYDSMG